MADARDFRFRLQLNLQLHTIDLVRTCCISSFCVAIGNISIDTTHRGLRRSMLHGRLATLVLLATEQDLTSQACKDRDGPLRMFDSMAHRRVQLF